MHHESDGRHRSAAAAPAVAEGRAARLAELLGTPEPVFQRDEVVSRLRAIVGQGIPIVGAGSSCGLVAKAAEAGGADLIVVYSTGISRLRGLPTTIFGNPNEMTLTMADELLNVVERTPLICGIEAADPHYVRLEKLLDRVAEAGYSGIINFPTVALYEPGSRQRGLRESAGFGFEREVAAVQLARDRGLFTMAYVFLPEEAEAMVDAGVDCVVAHVGGTRGGVDGFEVTPMDDALRRVREMHASSWARREDVLCLAHGGPLDIPENVEALYEHTDAQGFVGASSIERIPVENAVAGAVRGFKSHRVRAGA